MRVEQIYPSRRTAWPGRWRPTRNAEVVWCQEEPENMGAWTFMDRRIEKVLQGLDIKAKRPGYVGRDGGGEPGHRPRQGPRAAAGSLVREALGCSRPRSQARPVAR